MVETMETLSAEEILDKLIKNPPDLSN